MPDTTAPQDPQSLYHALIQAQSKAGVGLCIINSGRITYANDPVCEVSGFTLAELLALPSFIQMVHPDDRERVMGNHLRRIAREEFENRYDISLIMKDGERREVEITVSPLVEQGFAAILVILVDITKRKRAEEALRRSEDKFSQIFRVSPIGLWITRLFDGRFVDVNESFSRQFGWARDEVIGHTTLEIGLWPSPEARNAWIAKFLRNGSISDYETQLVTKGRVEKLFRISAEVLSIDGEKCGIGFVYDVSDLRQAEAELRASQHKFSLVFHASPVPILINHADSGRYLDANEAFTHHFGWTREEVVGDTSLTLGIWPSPRERDLWLNATREQGTLRDYETSLYTKAREPRTCVISTEFVAIDGADCVISILHDITDRTRAEREVRHLNTQLEERVQRRTQELTGVNQELESFAYSVSHDLRAPLRGIDGFSRLLQEEYGDRLDDQGREYLGRVRRATQRLGVLIDDLLDLSRVSRQEMRRDQVDLSAMARDICDELRRCQPERNVALIIADNCQVSGDGQLLHVLMQNLLDNAWKYSGHTESARIEFGRQEANGETVYFVRDNGAGFDMIYADKLFVPFQRLHNPAEFEGSGVGLASAARVVRRHGGRIWAEAAANRGAAFYFTLHETSGTH